MPADGTAAKVSEAEVNVAGFDRDSGRLTSHSDDVAEIRDVAFPPRTAVPDWLPDLAELAGGARLNAGTGVIEPVPDRWQHLQALSAKLAASNQRDPFAALGKWFLGDPQKRTLSPYSKLSRREYVERCLSEKDQPFLHEAERLSQDDPKLLEKVKAIRVSR